MPGLIGKKIGMTSVFSADGRNVPCTVIEVGPCVVTQVKTAEKDGYDALQLGFEDQKEKHLTQPEIGHFKKAGVTPKRHLAEFKGFGTQYALGDTIGADFFTEADFVDVIGTSKGKGYTGPILRWNQHTGPMAHGSKYHRGVGSLSANSDPSRVFKNKHMPGQYGNEQVTVLNLEVAKIDTGLNLIALKGAVPGGKGSVVFIRNTVKA